MAEIRLGSTFQQRVHVEPGQLEPRPSGWTMLDGALIEPGLVRLAGFTLDQPLPPNCRGVLARLWLDRPGVGAEPPRLAWLGDDLALDEKPS